MDLILWVCWISGVALAIILIHVASFAIKEGKYSYLRRLYNIPAIGPGHLVRVARIGEYDIYNHDGCCDILVEIRCGKCGRLVDTISRTGKHQCPPEIPIAPFHNVYGFKLN